jgi:hypothetical protein
MSKPKEKSLATGGAGTGDEVTFTITATQDRVTKNAVRFAEDVPKGVQPDAYVAKVGQIYIQKSALGGAPKRIELTLTVLEAGS